jgi:hypothetical protein
MLEVFFCATIPTLKHSLIPALTIARRAPSSSSPSKRLMVGSVVGRRLETSKIVWHLLVKSDLSTHQPIMRESHVREINFNLCLLTLA